MQGDFDSNIASDLKSDRLNNDVNLFMGFPLKELLILASLSFFVGMLVSVGVIAFFSGSFTTGIPAGIPVSFLIFFVLSIRISKLKRDKPSGYYQQYFLIRLAQIGLCKSPYVLRSGRWSTERRFKR